LKIEIGPFNRLKGPKKMASLKKADERMSDAQQWPEGPDPAAEGGAGPSE